MYSLYKLEDCSRAPKRVRQREITPYEEEKIILLRKKHIRYGKEKLKRIYEQEFKEKITSWKIQRVIETRKLYYNPKKTENLKKRKQKARKKRRITELKLDKFNWRRKKAGYIICLDSITIHWNNFKRYIFTAIDKYGKVAYARMYKNKSSKSGEDFLLRLHFLLNGNIPRIGHDNGTEFEKRFREACEKLKI